jgi:uncharacterized membrane protein
MHLFGAFIFAAGGLICHQMPERSFFWDGHQFPVCARCTGLYASAAIGVIGWVIVRTAFRRRRLTVDPRTARVAVVAAAIPTAISLATGALGLWDGSNITRALFAIPLGATGGAIVAAVAAKDLR